MKKERRNKIAGAAIALAMLGMMVGCGEKESSIDLMQGIKGEYIREEPEDEATDTNSSGAETPTFSGEASGNEIQTSGADAGEQKSLINADAGSVTDFGVRLLQQTLEEDKNTLVSPLSVISALGMTANGAAGDTLSQMEHTFGIALPELNEYLWAYREALPEKQDKYQLNMANAIWFRDEESFTVKEEFLQANADYYAATVKKAPFDDTTVKEINSWVSDNTNGMIDSILDKIPQEAVMCLVNALAFEAEWQETYYEHQVRDGEFTCEDGTAQNVKLMYSEENAYLEDDNAVGFVKYYADRKYAFAALLPEEGTSLSEYVDSLDGEKLHTILTNVSDRPVRAAIPKFESEYSVEMSEALMAMGMTDAFDAERADFSAMGYSENGNLYISHVLHKTFIAVDELGTKAGAATLVMMAEGCAMIEQEPVQIYLNRPFVYMIVDCENNIPVFIGGVREIPLS